MDDSKEGEDVHGSKSMYILEMSGEAVKPK
jgi:hypothetical protein